MYRGRAQLVERPLVFPARAGMNRHMPPPVDDARRVPRTRGDEPRDKPNAGL